MNGLHANYSRQARDNQQHPFFLLSAPGIPFLDIPVAFVGVRRSTVPLRFLFEGVPVLPAKSYVYNFSAMSVYNLVMPVPSFAEVCMKRACRL